jgi:hypothetical protein
MSIELDSVINQVDNQEEFSKWLERSYVVCKNTIIDSPIDALLRSKNISEKLSMIHSMITTEGCQQCQRKAVFNKYTEKFLQHFVNLEHKLPSIRLAELLGDLYMSDAILSAIHYYAFALYWAELCGEPEYVLLRLLSKMDKVDKMYYFSVLKEEYYKSKFMDGLFDDQLFSTRLSPDSFSKMLHSFVDTCSAIDDDTSRDLISNMAYSVITRISTESWRISADLTSTLTGRLLSLTKPISAPIGPTNFETHHILRHRRALEQSRQSVIDCRKIPCQEDAAIALWSISIKEILLYMINEVVDILGPPRTGLDFAIVTMGSVGRGEASAFSDLEMAIVFKVTSKSLPRQAVQEYINVFKTLLWFRIVRLMEDNTKISKMRGGIKLDPSFSFSPDGPRPLIFELSEIVREFKDGELILSNQIARVTYLWGKEEIVVELHANIAQIVRETPAVHSKMIADTLDELLRQYTSVYDKSQCFNVKEEIRLITLFVQIAGIFYGIQEFSTFSCINELVKQKKLHKGLAQALKVSLTWLLSLRFEIHTWYGYECDEFVFRSRTVGNLGAAALEGEAGRDTKYVLSAPQRRKWTLYSPMISKMIEKIIGQVLHARDFLTVLTKFSEQELHHLASYFVLQSEDELCRFRECGGKSMQSEIESSYWQDPIILRANYYFEVAVDCSVSGTQIECNNLISKFFNQTGPLCSIREQYQEQYLSAKPELYGRRRVIPLSSEVHLKIFPELPGQECLASEIAHRITGYTTSFCCLRKYSNRKPLLVSKTVIGINLQTLLKENPDGLEDLIDDESFSWQFIRTLLLNPEDDKPDNFMVMAYFDEWENRLRIKLVCVDNDHVFSEPVLKGIIWNELLVKTIILCSKSMRRSIHPRIVEFFTSVNLEEQVINICDAVIAVDDEHCHAFPNGEWTQESEDELKQKIECKIPMFVSEEVAVRLFVKLKTLKALMENNPQVTHSELIMHASLEPIVGKMYDKMLQNYPSDSSEERFTRLTSGSYKLVENTRMTISSSEKMLRSSLGKAPTKEEIAKRSLYTPRQMRGKFHAMLPQQFTSQIAAVRRALLAMDPKAKEMYYNMSDNISREQVISGRQLSSGENEPGIVFKDLTIEQQLFVIQLLKSGIPASRFLMHTKPHFFSRLILRNCDALKDQHLIKILGQSPQLQVLDVRDCSLLSEAVLENVPRLCPNLHVFLKNQTVVPSLTVGSLSVLLTAIKYFGGNNEDREMELDDAIECLENGVKNSESEMAVQLCKMAIWNMNISPDYLKAQDPIHVETMFKLLVQLVSKPDTDKPLFIRAVAVFLSVCGYSKGEMKLSSEIVREFARLCCHRLASEELRQEILPRENLIVLLVMTKLICMEAAMALDPDLRDELISMFDVLRRLPYDTENSGTLMTFWIGFLLEPSAVHLPQLIVEFVVNAWHNVAKETGLWATRELNHILFLPKLLYKYSLPVPVLLFLLESLGEVYILAETDPNDNSDEFPHFVLHLFIKVFGGMLIDSQLNDVSHESLDCFVSRVKEQKGCIFENPKATVCMAVHAAYIMQKLKRPHHYGFLLHAIAKSLGTRMLPKSKVSELTRTLHMYLNSKEKWIPDEEAKEICSLCIALDTKHFDIVALGLSILLKRSSICPTGTELVNILSNILQAKKSLLKKFLALYIPQIAINVIAFVPSAMLTSNVILVLEKVLSLDTNQINSEVSDDGNVQADAYVIMNAHIEKVLGPVEFPISEVEPAANTGDASNSPERIFGPVATTTIENSGAVVASERSEEEEEDEAETTEEDSSTIADVEYLNKIVKFQLALLVKQQLPQYRGPLLSAEAEAQTPEDLGQTIVLEMIQALSQDLDMKPKEEDDTQSDATDNNSPNDNNTVVDKFTVLIKYLQHHWISNGLSEAQQEQLISAVLSGLTSTETKCSLSTYCCMELIEREEFPLHCISPLIEQVVAATSFQKDGGMRQNLCWVLVQLIESERVHLSSAQIDVLITFFVSRVSPSSSTSASDGNDTSAGVAVTESRHPLRTEPYMSARQNSFVGLIGLTQFPNQVLSKPQLERIRTVLVENFRWKSVVFEEMNQIERDELRLLLSGEVLQQLNSRIAAIK